MGPTRAAHRLSQPPTRVQATIIARLHHRIRLPLLKTVNNRSTVQLVVANPRSIS
jgi:hypothetical protein